MNGVLLRCPSANTNMREFSAATAPCLQSMPDCGALCCLGKTFFTFTGTVVQHYWYSAMGWAAHSMEMYNAVWPDCLGWTGLDLTRVWPALEKRCQSQLNIFPLRWSKSSGGGGVHCRPSCTLWPRGKEQQVWWLARRIIYKSALGITFFSPPKKFQTVEKKKIWRSGCNTYLRSSISPNSNNFLPLSVLTLDLNNAGHSTCKTEDLLWALWILHLSGDRHIILHSQYNNAESRSDVILSVPLCVPLRNAGKRSKEEDDPVFYRTSFKTSEKKNLK